MSTQEFRVLGMSCGHCARFVTDELEVVPGVETVTVDLPAERVTVVSDRPLEPNAVRAAVEAAGYRLTDRQ